MEIGKKLREYRYNNNYSQKQVADLLEVSQNTYCDWESDKTFPKAENLSKVANLYDIDINDLLPTEQSINIVNSPNAINFSNSPNSPNGTNSPNAVNLSNSPNSKIEVSEALIKVSEGLEKLIDVIGRMIERNN